MCARDQVLVRLACLEELLDIVGIDLWLLEVQRERAFGARVPSVQDGMGGAVFLQSVG